MEIIKNTHIYVLKSINELRQNLRLTHIGCQILLMNYPKYARLKDISPKCIKIWILIFEGEKKDRNLEYKVLFSIVNGWACVEYSGILGQIPWIWIHRWLTMIESVIRERGGNGFEGHCDQFSSRFNKAAVITNNEEHGFEVLGKVWLKWMNCK